jgi:hypothetical protein
MTGMTMSLEPLVFRRVERVLVEPATSRAVDIIETTGVEVIELDELPPTPRQYDDEKPVPFAATLPHI